MRRPATSSSRRGRARPSDLPRLLVQREALVARPGGSGFPVRRGPGIARGELRAGGGREPSVRPGRADEGGRLPLSLVAQRRESRTSRSRRHPREIFDYLAATVLDGLPAHLQEFALYTICALRTDACCLCIGRRHRRRPWCLHALEGAPFRTDSTRVRAATAITSCRRVPAGRLARSDRRSSRTAPAAGRHLEAEVAGDQAVRHYLLAGAYADRWGAPALQRRPAHAQRAYVFRDLVRRLPRRRRRRSSVAPGTAASSCRFIGDYDHALIWSRQAMAAAEQRANADLGRMRCTASSHVREHGTTDRKPWPPAEDALGRLAPGVSPGLRGDLPQVLANVHYLRATFGAARGPTRSRSGGRAAHDPGRARGQALLTLGPARLVRSRPVAARAAFPGCARLRARRAIRPPIVGGVGGLASAHIALGTGGAARLSVARMALHAQVGERALELQLALDRGRSRVLRNDRDDAERNTDVYSPSVTRVRSPVPRSLPCSAWPASTSRLRTRRECSSAQRELSPLLRVGSSAVCCRLPADRGRKRTRRAAARRRLSSDFREAAASFVAWRSGPGEARCALLEARLRGGGHRPPRPSCSALGRPPPWRPSRLGFARRPVGSPRCWLRSRPGRVDAFTPRPRRGPPTPSSTRSANPTRWCHSCARSPRGCAGPAPVAAMVAPRRRGGTLSAAHALTAIGQPGRPLSTWRLLRTLRGRSRTAGPWTGGMDDEEGPAVVNAPAPAKSRAGCTTSSSSSGCGRITTTGRGTSSLKTAVKLGRRALEPWQRRWVEFPCGARAGAALRRRGRVDRSREHARLRADGTGSARRGSYRRGDRRPRSRHCTLSAATFSTPRTATSPGWRLRARAGAVPGARRWSAVASLASRADYERAATAMRAVVRSGSRA